MNTASNLPLVSIIIANWNGGQILDDCLSSLSKIDYKNWDLILVDNGSTDDSQNFLYKYKTLKFKLIQNSKNVGFAKANNQGFEISKGKYILLLNNDTKVEKSFLTDLVNKMEVDKSIGVIQPKIYLMDKPGYLDNVGSFFTRIGFLEHLGFLQKDSKEFDHELEIFSAKGACMLIRREVIDNTGLFDDDFFSYFEESDFCWRVWLAGWKVLFYPKAHIYHKLGFTIRRLNVTQLNYHYYKNRICSLIKNLGTINIILILVPHIIISASLIIIFLFNGQLKYAWMIKKAILWNLWNLSKTFKKRKKIQMNRKLDDNELFKVILHNINLEKFINDFRRVKEDIRR